MQEFFTKHKATFWNFWWRSLQILSKQGITLLVFIICAILLTPFDFGIYNYILAYVFLLIIFSDFGISLAASKFVAEYKATDPERLRKILYNTALIIVGFGVLVASASILLARFFFSEHYSYIFYVTPLLFLVPLTSLYDGIYRGLGRFKELSLITTGIGLLSLFFVFFFIDIFGLVGAFLAQVLFYASLLLVLGIRYREFICRFDYDLIKAIFLYSVMIGIANIGYFLYTRVDILMLGQYGFISEIGYYEIANKIFQLAILPVIILGTVIAPNTTRDFALNKVSSIKNKMLKGSLGLFLVGIGVSFLTFFVAPPIIKIVFPDYDLALLLQFLNLLIFIFPFRYFSTYLSVGYITPMGFVKITTITLLLFGLVNVALNILLIKEFGYVGVVYATLLSQIGYIFSNTLYFYFKLRNLPAA